MKYLPLETWKSTKESTLETIQNEGPTLDPAFMTWVSIKHLPRARPCGGVEVLSWEQGGHGSSLAGGYGRPGNRIKLLLTENQGVTNESYSKSEFHTHCIGKNLKSWAMPNVGEIVKQLESSSVLVGAELGMLTLEEFLFPGESWMCIQPMPQKFHWGVNTRRGAHSWAPRCMYEIVPRRAPHYTGNNQTVDQEGDA